MSDEMLDAVKRMQEEGLIITDGKGIDVLAMGLVGTLYLAEPWKLEVRDAVARCAEAYMKRWAPHLRWALHPHLERMYPFGEGMGSEPTQWLPDHDEEDGFSVGAHAAPDPRGASPIHVRAYCGARRPYTRVGRFQIGGPLFPPDSSFSLPDAVLGLCNRLRPLSGTGGIGIVEPADLIVAQRWAGVVAEFALRFPGLEADLDQERYLTTQTDTRGGIPGVGWLTIVGDHWLRELGGSEAVEAAVRQLDARFIVHRYEGGLMIQAGDHPELGDSTRDAWPALYVKLARYLKPIRVTPEGDAPTAVWLRRFDGR